jgi:hypothetical protein
MWQWLGLVLVALTTTIHSAVQGRTLTFWGFLPDAIQYEPAAVYGIIMGGPLYIVVCFIGGLIAIDRNSKPRWQRVPELFGLEVVPGRPLARLVPTAWLFLFVALPTFSLGHFLRKFINAYPSSCWVHWSGPACGTIRGKGGAVDIVPGLEPAWLLVTVFGAAFALGYFLWQLLRSPVPKDIKTQSATPSSGRSHSEMRHSAKRTL